MTMEIPTPQSTGDRHLLSRWVCWIVILVTVGSVALRVQLTPTNSGEAAARSLDNFSLRTAARAAVGTHALQNLLGADSKPEVQSLMRNVNSAAHTPREKICAAIVEGEIAGRQRALTTVSKIDAQKDMEINAELDSLTRIYAFGVSSVDPDEREHLLARYGWYGRLALVSDLPIGDPAHESAVASVRSSMVALTVIGIAIFGLTIVGAILFIIAAVFLFRGEFPSLLRANAPASLHRPPVFLEAFAIYIVGFVSYSEVLSRFVHARSFAWYLPTVLLLPIVMVWPMLRGMNWRDVRSGFGYCAPRGVLREPFMGLVGYVAGLPVVFVGLFASYQLAKFAAATPTHPIIYSLSGSGWHLVMIYILACVWAPVMEETMFRGALLSHLRGRWNWLLSSAVVGVMFAMIHPQGWTTIPALGSIGMVLCWIREWRGSIIGCMTAHAVNNGVTISLLLLLLR